MIDGTIVIECRDRYLCLSTKCLYSLHWNSENNSKHNQNPDPIITPTPDAPNTVL